MNFTEGMKTTGNIVQATPQEFFDNLNKIFNFTLDVCALPENAKCENYYTPETDGLKQPWMGGYGAILHTAEKSSTGSERLQKSTPKIIAISWLCSFLQERIQGGFRTMCTARHICISLTAD